MQLTNTSSNEDAILTDCESFGGKAGDAAAIAEDLDQQLTKALETIKELEDTIKDFPST